VQVPINLYNEDILRKIIGADLILVPGISHIYELDLALGEIYSLSRKELTERGAMFWKVGGQETYHYKICSVSPLQVDPHSTIRRKAFFVQNQFKTGYATHGLFPYRGKFHPQLIKAIMNIIKIPKGGVVLDSMTGSGTVNIEASIIGINSIGFDMSPFCVLMSRAKNFMLEADVEKLEEYAQNVPALYRRYAKTEAPRTLSEFGISETPAMTKMNMDEKFDELFLLAYLDAMGYSRRRTRQSLEKLLPVIVNRYVQAIRNFALVRDELELKLGKADIRLGDTRKLELNDNSVDGIVVSPPYSFAIDYIDNDRPQLEYLGVDPEDLRRKMVGLIGNTKQERVKRYFDDMKRIIEEYHRVLKPGKSCAIVIGSNEIQTGGVRHEVEFEKFAKNCGLILFKKLVRPISGIGNVMRDEYVLFFVKEEE